MTPHTEERRQRVLTDADLAALADYLQCDKSKCVFTQEEAQFVKDWLDIAKTTRSEIIKKAITGLFWLIGIVSGIIVAAKLGYFRALGK